MEEIAKIVIKGSSGFCYIDQAYEDKTTLTPNSFSYEYNPEVESIGNPRIKWTYKTTFEGFKIQFERISKMMPEIIEYAKEIDCLDTGEIVFIITYSNGTKMKQSCFADGNCFKELFGEIKAICPTKEIPQVLKTDEDYEE